MVCWMQVLRMWPLRHRTMSIAVLDKNLKAMGGSPSSSRHKVLSICARAGNRLCHAILGYVARFTLHYDQSIRNMTTYCAILDLPATWKHSRTIVSGLEWGLGWRGCYNVKAGSLNHSLGFVEADVRYVSTKGRAVAFVCFVQRDARAMG